MKKKFHYAAAGTLLLALTMGMAGGGAYAETANNANPNNETPKSIITSTTSLPIGASMVSATMFRSSSSHFLQGDVHERNYLKLLVKAYTPESEEAWNNAIEERKKAEEQLPKATFSITSAGGMQAGGVLELRTDRIEGVTAAVPAQRIEVLSSEAGAEGLKNYDVKVFEGPLGIPEKLNISRGVLPDGIIKLDGQAMELPPQIKLSIDFTKAVEANDEAAIKNLLPQLLEDYKNTTAEVIKRAELMKAKQTEVGQTEAGQAE